MNGEECRGSEGGCIVLIWSNSVLEWWLSKLVWNNNLVVLEWWLSKFFWGNNFVVCMGGLDGYRSDRGGGYGGERWMFRREWNGDDGDEEGDEEVMDLEDWLKREVLNWRLEGEVLYGVVLIRVVFLVEWC